MESFLIIRLSSLGDIIHTLPAYSALRKHRPEAHIAWLVERTGRDILDMVDGIDSIITVRDPAEEGGPVTKLKTLRRKAARPNLIAVDFQGLLKSALYARFSGARERIGFHSSNCREKQAALFYTIKGEPVSEHIHVIRKNLSLLGRLGITEEDLDFPLSIPPGPRESVEDKLRGLAGYSDRKKVVIYNVGAAWETKRWYPDRWADVIQKTARPDAFPLILWGTPIEKAMAEEIHELSGAPTAPELDIREVLALVSRASLVISGDTFALQAAGAFSTPVVALFGPTNPRRNGPFGSHDRVVFHARECSLCYQRHCKDLKCMDSIRADEVAANAMEIMKSWNDPI
jgi:heptosyltransferase-1